MAAAFCNHPSQPLQPSAQRPCRHTRVRLIGQQLVQACLSPVGKLAQANSSRGSGQEVAGTSRRLGGARARARALPPPPPSRRPRSPPLSHPRSLLPPPASPPGPLRVARGGGCRETPARAARTCTVSSGRRAERTQSRSSASACPSRCHPGPGLWRRLDPGSQQPAREPDQRRRSSDGMLSPLLG